VKKYGGDIPAGAVRTELRRIGAIEESDDGKLTATKRSLRPKDGHEKLLMLLVHGAYTMLSNIAHNTNLSEADNSWASRIAFTKSLGRDDKGQLRRITKDRIAEFAEAMDDIFIAYESLHEPGNTPNDRDAIAVAVYYFEETDEHADYEW
jgi:hypothetical protein